MKVVLFKIHTRSGVDATAYNHAFEHMLELVQGIPGFVDIEGYVGEDGSELAVARFESEESIRLWRDHPEHVETRRRGREEFFESYDITIAEVSRRYDWHRE
jgi:heme-degrading monooxygenase HmoA